ncbi:M1 family aminopeptidase [Granulicella sibirica]|uniref:Peptidase M1, membrane alanine aminopeptidase n=1 Tax=Granulicella sibirica TaxID=2479048 RepID=A0A4Q0SXH2_9BACT|nr:M1 family aminopeptidase [Granulicella sibirica]RXH55845.1 peptidase M1, membrane alanine aminopeptidase [Granulicella sibirica]
MRLPQRPARLIAALAVLCLSTLAAYAAPARQQINITAYNISADLVPASNQLTAIAIVTFTAMDDLPIVSFELNNGLALTKVTDGHNTPLPSERLSTNSSVRFTLATPLAKNSVNTWTFEYTGKLVGADTSPVEGIKLAAIGDPISILLYPGRWFPMTGLFTDRFTAEMHIRVPADESVVGSGSGFAAKKTLPANRAEYAFNWTKPGFPGTIIAGKFLDPITAPGVNNIKVWVTDKRKPGAVPFAQQADKEFEFMSGIFGQPESGRLNIVELPEDLGASAAWAPEIIAIAGNRIVDYRNASRLLANTLAHQWWGSKVSPYTLNDAWITNGMCRYAELLFLEDSAGKNSFQTSIGDLSAEALAYDTEPLTTLGRLDPYSPQFQSMTLGKGAMVFHMLRWELGDDGFYKFLKTLLTQYTDKGIRSINVQNLAENIAVGDAKDNLAPFFAQWLDGTGAPAFGDKFSVFRLGNNKGFRTIGAITQDLDLFRMPVELRIETDGKTELKRIDVSGNDSNYSIETFGRPRKITIDADNWLLKSTPDLTVRVAVLRGQQLVAQGDTTAALVEYQKALDANRNSSLASYRIGEIFFNQRNYQSAANSFRDALRGDDEPKWTEVWSHVQLGRIFDVTGQRDRAVNEYRLAVQTNDNTQGAVNEARASMQKPYKRETTEN